jgi:hypothetical protein
MNYNALQFRFKAEQGPCYKTLPQAILKGVPSAENAKNALKQLLDGDLCTLALNDQSLRAELEGGPGHVVLSAPVDWTDDQLRWAYASVLLQMGELNDRYGRLFDVVDRGLDHTSSNAPVSKTKAATGMHTDSSDANYNPDLVALLCLQPGSRGGASLLANAMELLDRLRDVAPHLESVARTPWARDVVTPGLASSRAAIKANTIPIFSDDACGPVFRYMRYWTERALSKIGRAIPSELTALFNFIDTDMKQHALRFQLKRGEMLIANNRTVVHGREAFEDLPNAAPRHLVRAWVDGFLKPVETRLSKRA